MPRAAVLGTGLIGASLGIALRGAGWRVTGWDPDAGALAKAIEIGAADMVAVGAEDAVSSVDLVVLAGPVSAIVESLRALDTTALVTDVAGVKVPVVAAAEGVPHFVGGHPMAGRETTGPDGASGSLFAGAPWVLTSDGSEAGDLDRAQEIVESVGAVPVVMTAEKHDAAVAAASHLPHLASAALVATLAADPMALGLAGGGFRDLTRISMSEPGWWADVLLSNRGAVSDAIETLVTELRDLGAAVGSGDRDELVRRLQESRRVRAGMAAPVATVGVIVEDRPGEIARVGHSLSESGVDLRDLQLRHATHGGGGVLTLSVRTSEEGRLRKALIADGFRLVETR